MANKRYFTDESLSTFVDEVKAYADKNINEVVDEFEQGFEEVVSAMYGNDFTTDELPPTIRKIANEEADDALSEAKTYTDNAMSQTTQVQIITWGADD